jgi:hypothetical protein
MRIPGKMKAGDLVRCVNANGLVGLILKVVLNAHGSFVYVVFVDGYRYPFRANHLELINGSR